MTLILTIILLLTTAARVWLAGVSVPRMLVSISQWLHFLLFGGLWGRTICAGVSAKTLDGPSTSIWRAVEFLLDAIFWLHEPEHCKKSLQRAETRYGH